MAIKRMGRGARRALVWALAWAGAGFCYAVFWLMVRAGWQMPAEPGPDDGNYEPWRDFKRGL